MSAESSELQNTQSSNNLSNSTKNNFKQFKLLNPEQQALVAATMVERMLPNYSLFCQVSEFGDPKVLRDALNIIWEKLQVKNLKLNIDKQLEKIEPNVPDEADFDLFGVYPALDAAMALITLFNGISGENEYAFFDVCKLSQATVSKVVEQELASEFDSFDETQIEAHELMQYENDCLAMFIHQVQAHEKPNKALISQFKQQALVDGVSNIGIEVG